MSLVVEISLLSKGTHVKLHALPYNYFMVVEIQAKAIVNTHNQKVVVTVQA